MKGQVTCYKVTKGKKKPKIPGSSRCSYLPGQQKGGPKRYRQNIEDKVINPSRVYLCTNSKMRSGLSHKVKATLYIFV